MSASKTTFAVIAISCAMVLSVAKGAEMALVPAGASGPHTVIGDEIVLYGADQTVTLEIRISDWTPHLLRSIDAQIDTTGYGGGSNGALHPVGWKGLLLGSHCATDRDCPSGYECWFYVGEEPGFCALLGHDPEAGAFIDVVHPEFVLGGLEHLSAVDLSTFEYRYGATLVSPDAAIDFLPPPKYCGTLILHVPADAVGTFTVGFTEQGTHIAASSGAHIEPLNLTPAVITVNPAECGNGTCDSGEDVISCPEDCEGPARLPMDIRPGNCWNTVNPRGSGVVPVALIGTESVSVRDIEPGSLALSRADGVGGVVRPLVGPPGPGIDFRDVGAPYVGDLCACPDSRHDGLEDVVLKFSGRELAEALELTSLRRGSEVVLALYGALLDGTEFEAVDCIVLVGPKSDTNPKSALRPDRRSRPK